MLLKTVVKVVSVFSKFFIKTVFFAILDYLNVTGLIRGGEVKKSHKSGFCRDFCHFNDQEVTSMSVCLSICPFIVIVSTLALS